MSQIRLAIPVDPEGTLRIVDPETVYWLEADGVDTLVHFARGKCLRARCRFAEAVTLFAPHRFLRVHNGHAVNLLHVVEVRHRTKRDFELELASPSKQVLHVGRGFLDALRDAFD